MITYGRCSSRRGPPGREDPYLLAAATHGTGTVLFEHLIGPKTNEVPDCGPPLERISYSRSPGTSSPPTLATRPRRPRR